MRDGGNTDLGTPTNQDLIFKEGGTTIGAYDGGMDQWQFKGGSGGFNITVNGVQKILFGNDITITDEIKMVGDIDLNSGSYIDYGNDVSSAGSFDGYVVIKVNGVLKKLPYYNYS